MLTQKTFGRTKEFPENYAFFEKKYTYIESVYRIKRLEASETVTRGVL